jgi:hypothetical protein
VTSDFSHFFTEAVCKGTLALGVSSDDTITVRLLKVLRIDSMLGDLEGVISSSCKPIEKIKVDTQELPLNQRDRSLFRLSRIQFSSDVKIISIPSHSEYSEGAKKVIWASSAEIRQNAQRNRREFAAEGWKWENVVEEDAMYFDKSSNERIHPVHLGGIMDLR